MKSTCCLAAVLAVLLAPRSHAAPDPLPKLAVLIVVDQMRADYVDRFKGEWTGGLKRMVTEGAWFQQAAYPYLTTVTCAGHATISTGFFPNTHGVFQNGWWDREAGKQVTCTEDPNAKNVGYGVAVPGGDSAYRLKVPTFADQMRSQRRAHVVSLSLKARSAIMLAGRGGDAVAWLTDTLDEWSTASGYSEKGVPAVKAFIDANPLAADFGKTWDRMLPQASYSGPDDGLGEAPPRGWTRSFPHPLKGTADAADVSFAVQWERTPFADAYLGRFAEALVESLQLGKHEGTDVLAISFSTPDVVGHGFGPASHEVQDIYAHLDKTLGALFDRLDTIVGKDQWVAGLSADHGVTPIPEQMVAAGKDAGRINGGAMVDAIEQVVRPVLGQGRHVIVLNTNDIYFEPGIYDKILKKRELMTSVISAIQARPGIQRAFRSEEIRGAATSKDPLLRAAALSYVPGRSGDIVLAAKPGWMISAAGTTHGSATADDQRVPILLLGHGVKPGRVPGRGDTRGSRADAGRAVGSVDEGRGASAVVRAVKPSDPFSHRVLSVVRRIPPGRVASYGEVAKLAGRPRAARAVGNIMRGCGRPDIPCHRVIAAGGRLGGYGGSEVLKRLLLVAEGIVVSGSRVRDLERVRWQPRKVRS